MDMLLLCGGRKYNLASEFVVFYDGLHVGLFSKMWSAEIDLLLIRLHILILATWERI